MATNQVSAQARGVVVVLQGKAWVVNAAGQRIELKVGDEVQAGQVVVTDAGTRLELALPNGDPLVVAAGRELLIDANLLGTAPQDRTEAALKDLNSGAAQVARVIASGGDLSTELEPTAAGATGGDSTESHSFVRVLRIDEALTSLDQTTATSSSQTTTPITAEDTPNQAPIAIDDALSATEDTPLTMTLADLVGNDTDPDGDVLSILSVQAPINGTVVLSGGNVIFTPDANYNGPASFSYTLSDGRGGSDTATVNLTVGAVNDPPVAVNDSVGSTNEDTPITLSLSSLLGNDTDVDGDTLTLTSVHGAVNGTVSLVNGSVVFTPTVNYSGPASFTYTISDGHGGSSTATVNLTVNPVNDAPMGEPDALTTDEDTPVSVSVSNLLGNDTDPEGDPLALTSVQDALHGTVAFVNGVVQFTPDTNYNGPASFSYTISDGQGGVSTATVNVTVIPINDGPDALDDALSTNEDQPITIAATTLLGNDIDVDGDALSITSVQSADHGTVALVNGNVVFTPTANYTGPASFTYTISDGHGGSDTATVKLNVVPVNDAPDAVDDTLTTDEDTPITILPTLLLGNDSDPDGDTLTVVSAQSAVNGSVALVNGQIVFTPNANYNGPASFTYTISDGHGGTDTATVNLVVRPVNDGPDAVDDVLNTFNNKTLVLSPASLLGNDSDPDGDPLIVTSVQGATHGTVALVGGNVVFAPEPGYVGSSSFTYTISDGHGGSDTATVTIDVAAPPNSGPDAIDDGVFGTLVNTSVSIPLSTLISNDSDTDGDPISIISVQSATHGSVSLIGGSAVFTPAGGYVGPAAFTYTISDGRGGSDTATVFVNVSPPANGAPIAINDGAFSTIVDTPLLMSSTALLGNDSDPEDDPLIITRVQGATHGTVALVNGDVVFTPAPGYSGPATFTYTISDGHGGNDTATVFVNVGTAVVNRNPDAVDDGVFSVAADTPLSIAPSTLLLNDSDPDGNPLTISGVQAAIHGTVDLVGGNVVFTPDTGYTGLASFTYTISDGNGGTDTATVSVTVGPNANDAPDAINDIASTTEDTPVTVVVRSNDTDPEGDTLTVTAVTNGANGSVTIDATSGNPVYTPNLNFVGTDTFTYTISDGNGGTDTATVSVTVGPNANDAPDAINDIASTTEDTP
ncbi:MAG: retention module-containing protein [Rhodoferax sp.]|nr:retention module-containing protein [Rhodoferax sp.]